MGFYTFLLIVEATVEGPDAGEAADTLSDALQRQAGWLLDSRGTIAGYLHDSEPYGRSWKASAVERDVIEDEQKKRERAEQAKKKGPKKRRESRPT